MKVDLAELQRAVNVLFDHLIQTRGVTEMELTQDYYWYMPVEDLYDVVRKPELSMIGSLADDWEYSQNLLRDEPLPVVCQFVHLAPLLRYVAEHLGPKVAPMGG